MDLRELQVDHYTCVRERQAAPLSIGVPVYGLGFRRKSETRNPQTRSKSRKLEASNTEPQTLNPDPHPPPHLLALEASLILQVLQWLWV